MTVVSLVLNIDVIAFPVEDIGTLRRRMSSTPTYWLRLKYWSEEMQLSEDQYQHLWDVWQPKALPLLEDHR